MRTVNAEGMKQQIRVSFDQILEKCETVGDLQQLDQEVKKLNKRMVVYKPHLNRK